MPDLGSLSLRRLRSGLRATLGFAAMAGVLFAATGVVAQDQDGDALPSSIASSDRLGPIVEQDDVRVAVSIQSQEYTYEITNLGTDPIKSVHLEHWRCYNHEVPAGWLMDATYSHIDTEASPGFEVNDGKSMSFRLRFGSGGATLAEVPIRIGFTTDRPPVEMIVWGPGPKDKRLVVLVVVGLAAIGLFHSMMVARGERRAARAD